MAKLSIPKAAKPTLPGPAPMGPQPGMPGGGGQDTSQAALAMSQPKAPGGNGFLINHNAFTDARPPAARGQKKSQGYPSFAK